MVKIIDYLSIPIKQWLLQRGFVYLANHTELILLLIFCSGLLPLVWKFVKWLFRIVEKIKTRRNLSPFIDRNEINEAVKYFVQTKGQNISPADEFEPRSVHAFTVKVKLINFFIKAISSKNNFHKHYLILADSGMGKSTFMINLFIKFNRKPFGKYKIRLLPLGHPETDNEIAKIIDQENTILLLDGFDEDPKAAIDYKIRLVELTKNKTWRFKNIFITSRTQFFPSEIDEPKNTELYKYSLNNDRQHYFKKIYISPFDDNDVKKYINRKFPYYKFWSVRKKNRAKKIIELCPNLMVRPMLLSYIDMLVDNNSFENIDSSSKKKFFSSSDIYEILINRWILRESKRLEFNYRENFIKNMYAFSENLAVEMFLKMGQRNGLFINADEVVPFAQKHNISLSEIELKGKSLLNRDASGKFKFAHKSILEFFLAKHAVDNQSFGDGVLYFDKLDGFDQASKFCNELMFEKTFQNPRSH